MERIDGWSQAGADVRAQVAVRPIGVLLGLAATANPLRRCPTYARLHDLDVAERVGFDGDLGTDLFLWRGHRLAVSARIADASAGKPPAPVPLEPFLLRHRDPGTG